MIRSDEQFDRECAEKILNWRLDNRPDGARPAWFDQDGHYKADERDFRPSWDIEEARYVIDKILDQVNGL